MQPFAIDVARYLIQLAASDEEPEYLTHLQLQKLLYYVQGWSLGMRGIPAFPSRIEAWAHGPVVRDVYPYFADYGYQPIMNYSTPPSDSLNPEDREFIESVWNVYKVYSPSSLREMTHKEAPWLDARKGYGPADRCEVEITQAAMQDFFRDSEE
jgi:uncharacterized phage-associated protein